MAIGLVISYSTALILESYQQIWLIVGVILLTGVCYILLKVREKLTKRVDEDVNIDNNANSTTLSTQQSDHAV